MAANALRISGQFRSLPAMKAYFHFPSPSTIVIYRSMGRSVKRSVFPPGWGHFTSSQSILVRLPMPEHDPRIV